MKYVYHINVLDPQSIDRAYKEILDYKNRILPQKVDEFTKELASQGVEIAQTMILDFDAVFTGELFDSISFQKKRSSKTNVRYIIKADSKHAIYVEMGTGIKGAETPYKGQIPVVYAQGKTIHYLEDGRYGWFYPLPDGTWRFTEGMDSRPFMLETANTLHAIINDVAKRIFG